MAKNQNTKSKKNNQSNESSFWADLKKIRWGKWKGKDGLWARFGKVLTFAVILLGFFTLTNFIISTLWRLF